MFTAADLIEVLRRRRTLKSIRPEVPGQLPPGWRAWLDAMPAHAGGVTGAPPEAFIADFLRRPLRIPPHRAATLTRWQAFATLWRQQWHPPPPEERGQRWVAGIFTVLLHLVFAVLLLWLSYVRFAIPPAPPEGDATVQVEYVGIGARDTTGGAPEAAGAVPVTPRVEQEPRRSSAVEPGAPTGEPPAIALPLPAAPQLQVPVPEVAQREIAEPAPARAPQPLQVTEVAEPDQDFVLPPPTPRLPASAPELRVPAPEIAQAEVVAPVTPVQRDLPTAPLPPPELEPAAPAVTRREVSEPARPLPTPEVPVRVGGTPELRAAPPAAAGARPAPSPTRDGAPTEVGTAGRGPMPSAAPGSRPAAVRSDDWGIGTRERAGGQPGSGTRPGLYDDEGRARLPSGPGSAGGRAPGAVEERIADLDRAGTWLRRPPYDYTPTVFDKYWRPHESLLAEWVRRSVRTVTIPIPGTSKRLVCNVIVLAVGGACDIVDPNLEEQPATARPPPDIPFKPHLQEDNGSVRPPPGG